MELLISNGANVNARDNKGLRPLHFAAVSGARGIAEALIIANAAVDAKDDDGRDCPKLR